MQIYRWTGSVWAVDYTLPGPTAAQISALVESWALVDNSSQNIPGGKTDVFLLAHDDDFPTPGQTLFDQHAVATKAGLWYYIVETGHEAASNQWTWSDLNDGHNDLAQWRGVVAENPFSIDNPQVLDWAYISGEHRWVRRNSSTWIYTSAPSDFDNRYRSEHSAERAGLTTTGKFIFVNTGHQMRIIRGYVGQRSGSGNL